MVQAIQKFSFLMVLSIGKLNEMMAISSTTRKPNTTRKQNSHPSLELCVFGIPAPHCIQIITVVLFLIKFGDSFPHTVGIWKPDHSKSGQFCPDFKWFLTKWRPSVQISNGWASIFQIPFENQTICNPTSFRPFKIQTCPDFRLECYTIPIGGKHEKILV